jgi:hypothetical protein
MARNLTPGFIAALVAPTVRPAFLISMDFSGATVYAWTGVGNITWNGQTWIGVGEMGSISTAVESGETQAAGITLKLSGIPVDLLGDSLNDVDQGRFAYVYLALFDANGNLIPNPVSLYRGLMDQPTIDISTHTASITVAVENRLVDMQRSQNQRYTDQNQRSRYPNDAGLSFVTRLQDVQLFWGHN